MDTGALAIEAVKLTKTYPGDVQAVKGISFKVATGEAFGLLGPNGAVKSTTIGMLNTTIAPSSGRAFLGARCRRGPIGDAIDQQRGLSGPRRRSATHRPPKPRPPSETVGSPGPAGTPYGPVRIVDPRIWFSALSGE